MAETQSDSAVAERHGNRDNCVVEFGDAYNRTITLDTLKLRVRGHFSITKLASRPEGGARDVGSAMGQMPDIPGQRLALDFRRRRYRLYDPLSKNEDLLKRINHVKSKGLIASGADFEAVPEQENQLSEDEWKTLLEELVKKKDSDQPSLKVIEGKLPSRKELDAMPGRRLNDPWNSGRKPRYHDEAEEYAESLDRRV